jgi:hypothetical protein
MKGVLPGKPEASLQAISTGYWEGKRIIVYVTGNALSILCNPHTLLQTIYDDDNRKLEAVTFDESSGKIAACTDGTVRIYRPLGAVDDSLKVKLHRLRPSLFLRCSELIGYSGHCKLLSKLKRLRHPPHSPGVAPRNC